MSLSIKKGDMVMVMSGELNKRKGIIGRVLAVYPKKEMALVEGANIVKKHMKPRDQQRPGGITEKEMPIHLSNLMLVDPKTQRPSRFANEVSEKGAKTRKLKRTGAEL